ncbi:MAG: hypothetical protein ACYDHN_16705, partial [Solirubrobacteraceae bacterium]
LMSSSGYGSATDLAEEPGSGGVAHRTPVDLRTGGVRVAQVAVMVWAVVLVAMWLLIYPRTPDLAAQVYRVGLFRQIGFAVWDEHWYAGHHLPGYSLLFPPLGAVLGIRLVGALAVLCSVALFERLTTAIWGDGARWGAGLFAVAAVGDVWAGRVTFALGVAVGLAAVGALRRGHPVWAAVAAVVCAAASPVAGALLGLAGLTWTLRSRTRAPVLVLAVPAAVLVAALALLFPEGGFEPYPILSFAATAGVVVLFVWAAPAGERMLRVGAVLYLAVCVLCLAVHSPVGSNVERYGVLLAGPLLACATMAAWGRREAVGAISGWRVVPVALALCASTVWVVWGPVRETAAVAGSPATSASYYEPVERFLASKGGPPVRVEVPLTRSHWEAALLAPDVSLARGWEKQLDSRYDGVLLSHGLTAAGYDRWLHVQAVTYVALPDVALDPSSAQEGRLVEGGVPFLQQVFASAHWRIYAVRSPTPLLTGAARLTALGQDSFALRARVAGWVLVRVHFSRYMTMSEGSGCVGRSMEGWTALRVRRPGVVVVRASFSVGRALGFSGSCS